MVKEATVAVRSARQKSVEYMAVWMNGEDGYLRTSTRGKGKDGQNRTESRYLSRYLALCASTISPFP